MLAIVYLIVVPSYRNSLENNELQSLETQLRSRAIPDYPPEPVPEAAVRRGARAEGERAGRRLRPAERRSRRCSSRSRTPTSRATRATSRTTRSPSTRSGARRSRAALVDARRPDLRRGRLPDRALGRDARRPRSTTSCRSSRSCAGASSSPARSRSSSRCCSGTRGASLFARRIRRLEHAADRIAAGQLRRAGRRSRLGRARPARPLVRADAPAPGAPRPRPRRVHRERLARAAHAALLARRLPRAARRPGARRGDARASSSRRCASRSTRLTKLATDLLDLSRLDAGRLAVVRRRSTSSELADELGAEFRARAATVDASSSTSRREPPVAGARRRRARPARSGASWSRTRSCTRRPARPSGSARAARRRPRDPDRRQRRPGHPGRRRSSRSSSASTGSTAAAPPGSGLGLAIARELAELMGGRIELDSQNGWTLFTLVLPVDTAVRDAPGFPRENALAPGRFP